MKINSHNIEFGYELLTYIPYAYWLYKNGKLKETISGTGSEPLYYFSPKHTINSSQRHWDNMCYALKDNIPNIQIHKTKFDFSKFAIPDYKTKFKNNKYKYSKPSLCICNRYSMEWGHEPINYFNLECLDIMFSKLKDKFQIIYIATEIPKELEDHYKTSDIGDIEFIKSKHKDVIIFQELLNKKKNNWNETILKVFVNCENYITMNGGYSILASYLGKKNIIYSKPGVPETKEIKIGSFQIWYPEFNNALIKYVSSYNQLYTEIEKQFVVEKPVFNIIVRTAKRINYFNYCIKSIIEQTYDNINIIICVDKNDNYSYSYAEKIKKRIILCDKSEKEEKRIDNEMFGVWFPQNAYLDQAIKKIPKGNILVLDDDDCLKDKEAITKITDRLNKSDCVFWRVDFKDRLVPNDINWEKLVKQRIPINRDLSMIGFAYKTSCIDNIHYGEFKRADYRVAKQLCEKDINIDFINEQLTSLQDDPHYGKEIDNMKNTIKVRFIKQFSIYEIGKEYDLNSNWATIMIMKGRAVQI